MSLFCLTSVTGVLPSDLWSNRAAGCLRGTIAHGIPMLPIRPFRLPEAMIATSN